MPTLPTTALSHQLQAKIRSGLQVSGKLTFLKIFRLVFSPQLPQVTLEADFAQLPLEPQKALHNFLFLHSTPQDILTDLVKCKMGGVSLKIHVTTSNRAQQFCSVLTSCDWPTWMQSCSMDQLDASNTTTLPPPRATHSLGFISFSESLQAN